MKFLTVSRSDSFRSRLGPRKQNPQVAFQPGCTLEHTLGTLETYLCWCLLLACVVQDKACVLELNGADLFDKPIQWSQEFMEMLRFLVSFGSTEPKSLGRGSEVPQRIPMCTTVCSQGITVCTERETVYWRCGVSLVNPCESFSKCSSRSTASLTWELNRGANSHTSTTLSNPCRLLGHLC